MFTPRKSRLVFAGGIALAASLVLAGCGGGNPLSAPTDDADGTTDSDAIVIGSQAYYSNEIIAEIYAQALENAGFEVDRQFNIGQRDAYMPDVESGAIDLFPEYTGNLLEFLSDDDVDVTAPEDVYAALQEALPDGLTALDYAGASDQDTYTVTKAFADEYSVTSIGDLADVDVPLTIGAAPEFEQRPYGPAKAKEVYGVDLAFSATGATTLEALLADTIQIADIYSADPAFQTEEIVALEDPENIILASNVVPIASSDVADQIADVINGISAALSVDDLVALNVQSSVDQMSSADIATEWLKSNGLI